MALTLVVRNECGNPLTDTRPVTLTTNRSGVDTLLPSAVLNGTGTYTWNIRSRQVGDVTYTAQIYDPVAGLTLGLSPTSLGQFVCVNGQLDISTNANTLQIFYQDPPTPPSGGDRGLVGLDVSWVSAGSLRLNSVSFGNSANVIWNAGPANTPISIGRPNFTNGDWLIGPIRRLTGFRPLQLNFNEPIRPASGSRTYTVIARWDIAYVEGVAPTNVCQSAPVSVTLP
jgi:hypothetical protein